MAEMSSCLQTRLTDFSNCRTSEDMELTHLGTLKTILSEVLLLSREQRRFRHDLRDGLDHLGGHAGDAAATPAKVDPSPQPSRRSLESPAKGLKRDLSAGEISESGALRAAVDALAREVAGLQSALKALSGATQLVPMNLKRNPQRKPSTASPVNSTASNSPDTAASAAGTVGTSSAIIAIAKPSSTVGRGGGPVPKSSAPPGTELDRATAAAASFASASSDMEFASVVLVGRQQARNNLMSGRRSATLASPSRFSSIVPVMPNWQEYLKLQRKQPPPDTATEASSRIIRSSILASDVRPSRFESISEMAGVGSGETSRSVKAWSGRRQKSMGDLSLETYFPEKGGGIGSIGGGLAQQNRLRSLRGGSWIAALAAAVNDDEGAYGATRRSVEHGTGHELTATRSGTR
jgi:hypothetical protein